MTLLSLFSDYQYLDTIYHFMVQPVQPEHTWGTLLLVSAVDEETRRCRLCRSRVSVCVRRCDGLWFFQHEELWRRWRNYQWYNRRSWIKTSSARKGLIVFEKVRYYCWITSRKFVKKIIKKIIIWQCHADIRVAEDLLLGNNEDRQKMSIICITWPILLLSSYDRHVYRRGLFQMNCTSIWAWLLQRSEIIICISHQHNDIIFCSIRQYNRWS